MRYFVIRGFGKKTDSKGQEIDFDRVDRELIEPAMRECQLEGGTTGQVADAGNIRLDMFALILEADVVVCDITIHNANVFYELGVRHALRKKSTVLIKGSPSADTTPFDLSTDRYLSYPVDNPGAALDSLKKAIRASIQSDRETDSPIFLLLPNLPQVPREALVSVPMEFIEEVDRAREVKDIGWLRLLADNVQGLRFEWEGLKRVAKAQWDLEDWQAAQTNWESIRSNSPDDVDANLALANIYERRYKLEGASDFLTLSNQAIDRLLNQTGITPVQRAESLALKARNFKTLWRQKFRSATTAPDRRVLAYDIALLDSYDSYKQAFEVDLNHCFSGIACLQVGYILLELAKDPQWDSLFTDEREARRRLEDLGDDWEALRHTVQASIKNSITFARDKEQANWARISDADLMFLKCPEAEMTANSSRLRTKYRSAVPPSPPFVWQSTRAQLQLFADLDMRADLACQVIADLDTTHSQVSSPAPAAKTRQHLIVFVGHSIDASSRTSPRFPASAEPRARALIGAQLNQYKATGDALTLLASAAPGADLIFHEVCSDLGLLSTLCIPMPLADVAAQVFGTQDDWRNRLLAVAQARANATRVLQSSGQLPNWLNGRAESPWDRGTDWVMRSAEAWGADKLTLLALWDGNDGPEAIGGTWDAVRFARRSGHFRIDVIDTKRLLNND